MKLKKQLTLDIDVNPQDVAYLFHMMDDKDQARFFNYLAAYIATWDSPLIFQLQSMIDTGLLTAEAKKVMKDIGEYADAELTWLKD